MSSSQIKNSASYLDRHFDHQVNLKAAPTTVALAVTPSGDDSNPYAGGTAPSSAGSALFHRLSEELVVVSWSTVTGTGGAAKKLGWNVVPSQLRPTTARAGMCKVTDNGTVKDGVVKVLPTGDLVFSITADAAFAGSGATGMTAGSMIYSRV